MSNPDDPDRYENLPRQGDAFLLQGGIDDIKREQAEQKKREDKRREQEVANQTTQVTLNSRLVKLTGVLAVFSLLGLGIAIWQSTIAQRAANAAKSAADSASAMNALTVQAIQAAKDSAEAAKSSAATSQRQADAALEAVALSRTALHTGQRAYVWPNDVTLKELPTIGGRLLPEMSIKNSGATPAIGVRISVAFQVLKDESLAKIPAIDESFQDVFNIGAGESSKADLLQDEKMQPASLSPADLSSLKNKTGRLFLVGRIEYRDIFGNRHITEYCFEHINALTSMYVCRTRNNLVK